MRLTRIINFHLPYVITFLLTWLFSHCTHFTEIHIPWKCFQPIFTKCLFTQPKIHIPRNDQFTFTKNWCKPFCDREMSLLYWCEPFYYRAISLPSYFLVSFSLSFLQRKPFYYTEPSLLSFFFGSFSDQNRLVWFSVKVHLRNVYRPVNKHTKGFRERAISGKVNFSEMGISKEHFLLKG